MKNKKNLLCYILGILAGLCVYSLINFIFHPYIVQGVSMEPTLKQGYVLSCTTDLEGLQCGDIVILKHGGLKLVKRIAGLPGDVVSVKDHKIYVNDILFDEIPVMDEDKQWRLGSDQVFVLGDNRSHSSDSRTFGPVMRRDVKYKYKKILFRIPD